VTVLKLGEQPIVDFDDYLGSLTSRRSISVYPRVSGYVQSIAVKPGAHVTQGARLIDIDPGPQVGTLRNLEATLASRRANLAYAIQDDESSRRLMETGSVSALQYQQRHSQRLAAEGDVRAAQGQVRAQIEQLRFYRITAPADGTVGDVPVKIGDAVTPQTQLTSVASGQRLEAYVYIPVDRVEDLTDESTVALLGEGRGVVCEQKPWFVSPEVDVATQSILLKTICPDTGALRTAQVLTARVTWARHPGLKVPTRAVNRLAGQYFVFIAEHGPQGTVARQRPIAVGSIQANDYIVKSGLSSGEELVTSNVQKIRDGAPIAPTGPQLPGGPNPTPAGGGPPD
jgi:RND family efflux transporter MFP subunit